MMKIMNTGTADIEITEFIVKATKLAPGASMVLDLDTKKVKIGDIEIILS